MGPREVIGLIAGTGRLPEILADAVKAQGHGLVCVIVQDDPRTPYDLPVADYRYRVPSMQIERIRTILQSHGVRRALLAGKVPRTLLVDGGDAAFRDGLARLGDRRDHSALRLIAEFLAEIGISVVSPLEFVRDLVVEAGVLTRRAPTHAEWDDVRFGMPVARAVASMDVGQTVVVKDGVILAVEAAEGTDATIQRGGGLIAGVAVIKAARPHQDERFDLPAIGTQTIEVLRAARATVLAFEAGRTLLLDRTQSLAAADDAGIAVVAVEVDRSGASAAAPTREARCRAN